MVEYYIARQPILDANGHTIGYELLFRSTRFNAYDPTVDGDSATAQVLINTIVEAGLSSIVGKAKAFVNLTNAFLETPELLDLLPPGQCVLEVLESVEVTDRVVEGIRALLAKGHTIALDDFVGDQQFERLLPLVSIIKYDLTQHSMEALAQFAIRDRKAGRLSLIERVETHDEYEALKAIGFHYFQGYYFARPGLISGSKIPENRVTLLKVLSEIHKPDATIDDVANSVSQDVSLGVRMLKYLNSPAISLVTKVTSIKHATVLLGQETIRNWATLLVMIGVDEKPPELMKMALTRAKFCQSKASESNLEDEPMYFTIGLLSLLGVLTDTELPIALEHLPITETMRLQLVERSGHGGEMLDLLEQLENNRVVAKSLENGPMYYASTLWTERAFAEL